MVFAGARHAETHITSPGLADIWTLKILPLLTLKCLAATACTCMTLRQSAYERAELWVSKAAELLPPQLTSAWAKDRSTVQAALQRHFKAVSSITNGQPALSRHITVCTSAVKQLVFSPCRRKLAVVTDKSIGLFDVQSGKLLWRRGFKAILLEGDVSPLFAGELRLQGWHISTKCASAYCWCPTIKTVDLPGSFHPLILQLELLSGAIHSFRLVNFSIPMLSLRPYCKGVFSPTGQMLAFPFIDRGRDNDFAGQSEWKEVILVADAHSALVQVMAKNTAFRHLGLFVTESAFEDPIWSRDERLVASQGHLVHVQTGRADNITNRAGLGLFGKAFSKTGRLLGLTCYKDPHYVGSDSDGATFVRIIDTASLAEVFKLPNATLLQFYTCKDWILGS